MFLLPRCGEHLRNEDFSGRGKVETAMQQSPTPTTFRRETEGDQKASGCTAELRRHQRIAGLGVESSPLGTEAHT